MGRAKRKKRGGNQKGNTKFKGTKKVKSEEKQKMVEHKTRESFARRLSIKLKLKFTQLERTMEREENRLRHYNENDNKPKEKKKWEYELKGAARPAWQVYPELYPEKHAEIAEQNKRVEFDLFEKTVGAFAENKETKQFLISHVQFAHLCKIDGRLSSAVEAFERALELDSQDFLGARLGLIASFVDIGELDPAAELLDKEIKYWEDENVDVPSELLYSKALIEYITHVLIEDEQEEEETTPKDSAAEEKATSEKFEKIKEFAIRAIQSNPYIAQALSLHEHFEMAIDPVAVDDIVAESRLKTLKHFTSTTLKKPSSKVRGLSLCSGGQFEVGTKEEAVLYFCREVSCWRDADGAMEWIGDIMQELIMEDNVELKESDEEPKDDYKVLCDMFADGMEAAEQAMEQAMEQDDGEELKESNESK